MDGMNITGTPADNTHDIKRKKFNLPEAKLPSIMMGQKETSLNDKLNEPLAGWTVEKSGETMRDKKLQLLHLPKLLFPIISHSPLPDKRLNRKIFRKKLLLQQHQ